MQTLGRHNRKRSTRGFFKSSMGCLFLLILLTPGFLISFEVVWGLLHLVKGGDYVERLSQQNPGIGDFLAHAPFWCVPVWLIVMYPYCVALGYVSELLRKWWRDFWPSKPDAKQDAKQTFRINQLRVNQLRAGISLPGAPPPTPATVTCQWCLEEVKFGARVCKHCGKDPSGAD